MLTVAQNGEAVDNDLGTVAGRNDSGWIIGPGTTTCKNSRLGVEPMPPSASLMRQDGVCLREAGRGRTEYY